MKNFPKTIPVFPLSNFIIFPKTTVPLNIFEERYLNMVDDAMKSNKFIGMIQPVKSKNENTHHSGFNYAPFMASLLDYMIDQGMEITPLPNIILRKDEKEANDFFCKTAHYSPDEKKVVLYILGRHPKDVMRSFSHEMIHHMQNLEGKLGNIKTTNTNQSNYLQEIEKEAYLKGNILFRNWEDGIKNNMDKLENKENFRILDNKLSSKED